MGPRAVRRSLRAPVLLAALAGALLGPVSHEASAGTYEVTACGGAAGGAHGAFAASADSGMAAYSTCPNTPSNAASGLVTRASITAGRVSVPYFAGAYQVFEAPPGASLQSVSFDLAALRLSQSWTTGIVAYDGDFNRGDLPYGCYAGSAGCGIGSASFFGPVTVGLGGHSRFRFETRCGGLSGCDISSSGYQPAMRALFSAANIKVRVQDSTAPQVTTAGGGLFSGSWLRGPQSGSSNEVDNVGIMVNRALVDGNVAFSQDFRDPSWPDWVRCNFTRRAPCASIPGAGTNIDTRSLADGEHDLRIEAVDAAGNAAGTSHRIRVDNTAPEHVDVAVEGGEGWHRTNGFDVRWTVPGGQAAPIAGARYRLCSTDGASCVEGSQSGRDIERLSQVRVPGPGDYLLQVWLEDEAGNQTDRNASLPVHLRFDDVPPELADFELLDETDPRRVDAVVSDSTSGVAAGTIEIRRSGHRQWHSLSTTLSGGGLSAYLDDLSLPDGVYDLRAIVSDRAGNERFGERRRDGAPMQLTLPLRDSSRLVLSRPSSLTVGPRATIRARLETGAGRPIAGQEVSVFEQVRTGGGFKRSAPLRSDARGQFSRRLSPGPSRTLRLAYAGTRLIKPATIEIEVRAPATTTIRTTRRAVRNGASVRFSGRLGGRPVPGGGKLIDLQAHYRGRWRTFATPRTGAAGRWSFRYRFEATRGVVTYRFRAIVPREAAYPYELGRSRVVAVRVRGR